MKIKLGIRKRCVSDILGNRDHKHRQNTFKERKGYFLGTREHGPPTFPLPPYPPGRGSGICPGPVNLFQYILLSATLVGPKKIVRYTGDVFIKGSKIPGFHNNFIEHFDSSLNVFNCGTSSLNCSC